MTDILTTEAAAPITATDLVPGAVFIMSAFAVTISGPQFDHHFPILIKPFHQKFPENLNFWALSRGGNVRDNSRLIPYVMARIHRPTEADKALITKLVARTQHEIDQRQAMVYALKPFM